jgi:chorismate mutase
MSKFYVVSSDILPEVLEKVMDARLLLQTGKVRRISEAVKEVGISRGTYYKYKDAVFAFSPDGSSRKAIFSLILENETGALNSVLTVLVQHNVNILALNQSIPINGVAALTITLDLTAVDANMDEILQALDSLAVVQKSELVAVE